MKIFILFLLLAFASAQFDFGFDDDDEVTVTENEAVTITTTTVAPLLPSTEESGASAVVDAQLAAVTYEIPASTGVNGSSDQLNEDESATIFNITSKNEGKTFS